MYLDTQYEYGNFIASVPKSPRTRGVIFTTVSSMEELNKILSEDPFKVYNLANYDIVEFQKNKSNEALASLILS